MWWRPGRPCCRTSATPPSGLVSRFQMDEATTLQTWTVMETLLATIGFVLALLLNLVL
jgi:hypothetical protein